jgi:hypothetical protein
VQEYAYQPPRPYCVHIASILSHLRCSPLSPSTGPPPDSSVPAPTFPAAAPPICHAFTFKQPSKASWRPPSHASILPSPMFHQTRLSPNTNTNNSTQMECNPGGVSLSRPTMQSRTRVPPPSLYTFSRSTATALSGSRCHRLQPPSTGLPPPPSDYNFGRKIRSFGSTTSESEGAEKCVFHLPSTP